MSQRRWIAKGMCRVKQPILAIDSNRATLEYRKHRSRSPITQSMSRPLNRWPPEQSNVSLYSLDFSSKPFFLFLFKFYLRSFGWGSSSDLTKVLHPSPNRSKLFQGVVQPLTL